MMANSILLHLMAVGYFWSRDLPLKSLIDKSVSPQPPLSDLVSVFRNLEVSEGTFTSMACQFDFVIKY